jgi:ribonucleotide reductase alpha subunit
MRPFSNLSRVVYSRTYSRKDSGTNERWENTVDRFIGGNVRNFNVSGEEIRRLKYFALERKAMVAGRGLWFSGSPSHSRLGGEGLVNCYAFTADDWQTFVTAQSLLMLGGGVGLSVESRFVNKLPKVKSGVKVVSKDTKDADFIVPDSREGWCKLLYRTLEAFFVTGKSFSYSTVCIRGAGESIKGFGGVASGPLPLIRMIEKLSALLSSRDGRHIRPIDAADIVCIVGEMVVAGNVRRSAIMIMCDAHDREILKAKRWDLGVVPSHRAMANFSVIADDPENDLRPLFWATYEQGEPFGIINRTNIQKYGRMGELSNDTGYLTNPCGEATLEPGGSCNLQDINLAALDSMDEFIEAAKLMHRYGKRVACEKYQHKIVQEAVAKSMRVGTGITGCLEAPRFFNPQALDQAYAAIQEENERYSLELGVPRSIRTTVIKPSGTLSKLMGTAAEGIHPAYSRHYIQRIRFSSSDKLVPALRRAGHHIEPAQRIDGSLDPSTVVVDFYVETPPEVPTADGGFDTWKQLDVVKMAQKHWADQAISVTVYYQKKELDSVKDWVKNNLHEIKTVSFLPHSDHGFVQAPKETITAAQYDKLSSKIKLLDEADFGDGELVDSLDCVGGCPIK